MTDTLYRSAQPTAAGMKNLEALGVRIEEISLPFCDHLRLGWLSLPFTLLWIAGVINAPAKNKRNFWVDGADGPDADNWLATAREVPGSWWPTWSRWLESFKGGTRGSPAQVGSARYPAIEPAPPRWQALLASADGEHRIVLVCDTSNGADVIMAGRDISVTHEALGAVRVMRTGKGAPLLLLRGDDASEGWRDYMTMLAENYDVIAPEHPGFGGSDTPAWLGTIGDLANFYLDFLDQVLTEEVGSKQRKRIAMGIQIAHFPTVKTLEDFDFKFQPSVDAKLVRELSVEQAGPGRVRVRITPVAPRLWGWRVERTAAALRRCGRTPATRRCRPGWPGCTPRNRRRLDRKCYARRAALPSSAA